MPKKAVRRGVRRSAWRVLLLAAGGVLVALAVSIVGPSASALGYVSKDRSVSNEPNALTHHPDWMKSLPDSVPLGALSIPGSHDSIALYGGPSAEDQSMSIPQQLESGMRYFDIRTGCEAADPSARDWGPPWRLEGFHGIIGQRIDLGTILDQMVAFFHDHPGETILTRLSGDGISTFDSNPLCQQQDGTWVPQKKAFVDQYWNTTLPNKSPLFWKPKTENDGPPTLGQARGHIVLLPGSYYTWDHAGPDGHGHTIPAMPDPPLGLSYEGLEKPTGYTPGGPPVTIVDKAVVALFIGYTRKDKLADSVSTIKIAAGQSPAVDSTHIEATATEGSSATVTSRENADVVNSGVLSFIYNNHPPKTGVVFGDWFGPGLIDAIIARTNLVGCQGATVAGTRGSEALSGTARNDVIKGGPGNDVIKGGPGNDRICGDNGNDVIYGGNGNDVIYGGNGNDVIEGGPGNDVIHGGNGNDVIEGGHGNDTIYAADGRRDLVDCGAGRDTATVDPHDTVAGNCERVILKKG